MTELVAPFVPVHGSWTFLPDMNCLLDPDSLSIPSSFSDVLNSARDDEERNTSGKLFQTKVAATEKVVPPMVGIGGFTTEQSTP